MGEYEMMATSDTGEGGWSRKISSPGYNRDTNTTKPANIKIHYQPYDAKAISIIISEISYKRLDDSGHGSHNERDVEIVDEISGKSITCRFDGGRLIGDCKVRGNINLLPNIRPEGDDFFE